jgi:chromosome segregation ATPase
MLVHIVLVVQIVLTFVQIFLTWYRRRQQGDTSSLDKLSDSIHELCKEFETRIQGLEKTVKNLDEQYDESCTNLFIDVKRLTERVDEMESRIDDHYNEFDDLSNEIHASKRFV